MKKISVNKFETTLKENNVIEVPLRGSEDIVMEVKPIISLSEMVNFVQGVVSSCFDENTDEYVPEAYDFAIRSCVLAVYANFTMPKDLDKRYMLVYASGAFEQVMEYVNPIQFNDIVEAIDKKIANKLQLDASAATLALNELIAKIGDTTDETMKMLDGVSGQDMAGAIKKLSEMKDIAPETIAEIVLEREKKDDNDA